MIYTLLVKEMMQIAVLAPAFLAAAHRHISGKAEFGVGSIKTNRQRCSESHDHCGAVVLGTNATYQASALPTADLARALFDQTGLRGKSNMSLRRSSTSAADASGPTEFDALQQQLGLRVVPGEQTLGRLCVVDRGAQRPTES